MAEDVRLLTYDEIASAFGITRESARQLVIRKRWARRKGNDNRARIEVPEEALASAGTSDATGNDPSDDTGDTPSDRTGEDTSDLSAAVAVLERHTGRLEAELATAREALASVSAERDAERARAGQVAVLNAVLDLERKHAEEVRADRDRWREAATAPRGVLAWLRRRA